jgi:hypothetical protein
VEGTVQIRGLNLHKSYLWQDFVFIIRHILSLRLTPVE